MLDKIFRLKDTIDIFVSETESPGKILIIFHKMTTRDRIEMIATKDVAKFIALLDGKSNSEAILENMGHFSKESALSLINYLSAQHLITDASLDRNISSRYLRQVPYFDDMVLDRAGQETQELLSRKRIVVLGCGSTGSAIAEVLVRVGIKKIILIDYKNITEKISTATYTPLQKISENQKLDH